MDKNKGYPLPAVAYTEDMVCQLVYYPDKPEYRRALLGSLTYLATWIAWEKEPEHKGIDASLSWKIALDATMECWQMACLEQLQEDVAAILEIMKVPQACCDAGDFSDGDQYTDRVEDGVGNVPQNIIDAGYASGVGDWDGFDDYKCMIAHVTVSQLSAKLLEIAPLIDLTGGILGGVAALAGILAVIVGTGGLAIVFGIVAGIGATSLLYQAITDFGLVETLAAKVVTNHDDLACAIYEADGDEDALTSLNTAIDDIFTVPEALILKNMNAGPTLKALYAGRYDQQDIADILLDAGYELGDFSCTCDENLGEYQHFTDWEGDDWNGWTGTGGSDIDDGYGVGGGWVFWMSSNNADRLTIGSTHLATAMGLPGSGYKFLLHRVIFTYKFSLSGSGEIQVHNHTDTGHVYEEWPNSLVYVEETLVFDPPIELTWPGNELCEFKKSVYQPGYIYIDNITLDFDHVAV